MLCVGIGGGGDVVGVLAASQLAVALGCELVVGGLTWERRPVDPIPGPRRLNEVSGAQALNAAVALAGLGAPATIVIGDVVAMRGVLAAAPALVGAA